MLLPGDSEAEVHLVRRCRGRNDPRSAALMHLMGVVELAGG